GVPPPFATGPFRLHCPQLGGGLLHPVTLSVRTPLLMTLLSCDCPVQPVSRSAVFPSASKESNVGQFTKPGVGVAVGPPPGVVVAVAPPPLVGVAVGAGAPPLHWRG